MINLHPEHNLISEINNTKMLENILVNYANESFIRIEGDDGLSRTLGDYFSFYSDNYKWNPRVKSGTWDGRIRLFDQKHGLLPRGLLKQCLDYFGDSKIKYNLDQKLQKKLS